MMPFLAKLIVNLNPTWVYLTYLAVLLVAIGLVYSEGAPWRSTQYERRAFFWLGGCLVFVTSFRPQWLSIDDYGYYWAYGLSCKVTECGKLIQGDRDFLWYSLIGWLKTLYDSRAVILWAAGAALLLKLFVIYRLCRYRVLALFVYASIFYLMDDIIAHKASLAVSLYFLGIYWLVELKRFSAAWACVLSGCAHIQGAAAPLLFGAPLLGRRAWVLAFWILLPMVLLVINVYPSLALLYEVATSDWFAWLKKTIPISYSVMLPTDGSVTFQKLVPLVVPPALLCAACLVLLCNISSLVCRLSAFSVGLSAWFVWGFATTEVAQFRFFEYFFSPIVLLVGNVRLKLINLGLVLVLASLFIIRYNVLHTTLIEYSRVRLTAVGSGILTITHAHTEYGFLALNFPLKSLSLEENAGSIGTRTCGASCEYYLPHGYDIDFHAQAGPKSRLEAWSVPCAAAKQLTVTGAPVNPCAMQVTDDLDVTAYFGDRKP